MATDSRTARAQVQPLAVGLVNDGYPFIVHCWYAILFYIYRKMAPVRNVAKHQGYIYNQCRDEQIRLKLSRWLGETQVGYAHGAVCCDCLGEIYAFHPSTLWKIWNLIRRGNIAYGSLGNGASGLYGRRTAAPMFRLSNTIKSIRQGAFLTNQWNPVKFEKHFILIRWNWEQPRLFGI